MPPFFTRGAVAMDSAGWEDELASAIHSTTKRLNNVMAMTVILWTKIYKLCTSIINLIIN